MWYWSENICMHREGLIFNTAKNGAVVGTASSNKVSDIRKALPFIVNTAFLMDRCVHGTYWKGEKSYTFAKSIHPMLNWGTKVSCWSCEWIWLVRFGADIITLYFLDHRTETSNRLWIRCICNNIFLQLESAIKFIKCFWQQQQLCSHSIHHKIHENCLWRYCLHY